MSSNRFKQVKDIYDINIDDARITMETMKESYLEGKKI